MRFMLILGVVTALAVAVPVSVSGAVASASPSPGRVVVSADVWWKPSCGPGVRVPGHVEVSGVDHDRSVPQHSWDRQKDFISITLTRGAETWTEQGLWLSVTNRDAVVSTRAGAAFWLIHDGGIPGSRIVTEGGATMDYMRFTAVGSACKWLVSLDHGDIRITAARFG